MPDRPGHPPATTIQNATAVVITRRADAERLIADLRSALRRSGRTGGRYAAFAHDAAGAATITLAIHLDGTDRRPRRRPPPPPAGRPPAAPKPDEAPIVVHLRVPADRRGGGEGDPPIGVHT